MSNQPLFLGLDLSTQQIKAALVTGDYHVVHATAVHFDKDLPWHGTSNGANQGPGEGEVTSPIAMWLEAIDILMDRMKRAGVDFGAVAAVSGAGQVSGTLSHYHAKSADLDSNMALSIGPRMQKRPCQL
jgi:xylulokinase